MDASNRAKVARSWAFGRPLSYDAAVPSAAGQRAAFPRGSCPRFARSGPFDTTSRRSAILPASSPRHTTSSATPSAIGSWLGIRPTSCGWTCPARRPVTLRTIAIAEPPGRSPAGARTGPSTRTRIRRSTSTSSRTSCPGPTPHERRSASSAGFGSSRPAPARASCPTSGPWPDPGKTATSCSAPPASTPARSWSSTTTRRRREPGCSTGSGRASPTSRSAMTTACSTGCGRSWPMATPPRRLHRCWRRPRTARSRSPMAITAMRPRCSTATSGGCPDRARRIRRSTTS